MMTYSVKILNKILNEVPDGKIYHIVLGEQRTIYQIREYTDQYQFSQTIYENREEILKAVVHNGCIELHLKFTTYSVFNEKKTKIKEKTWIEFIPFSQITNIIYADAEQ